MSVPAWLQRRIACDEIFEARSHYPAFGLTVLLHEIGQFQIGKDFWLVEPPRSIVYHPGQGLYLFQADTHLPFATFDILNGFAIKSVGLRYRDPLTPASKLNQRIVSGWMGTAQLIDSAVRRSPFFGKLQMIETVNVPIPRSKASFVDVDSATLSTYEVWVTPRRTWSVSWQHEAHFGSGTYQFQRNVPVLLARVKVERPIADSKPDIRLEVVKEISLYPEIVDAMFDEWAQAGEWIDAWWQEDLPKSPAERKQPFKFIDIEGQVMNLPPHSELKFTYR